MEANKAMGDQLATFIALEEAVREAKSPESHAFVACNSTKRLIDYDTAVFYKRSSVKGVTLRCISGEIAVNADSPWVAVVTQVIQALLEKSTEVSEYMLSDILDSELLNDAGIRSDTHVLWCPYADVVDGADGAGLVLIKSGGFFKKEIVLAEHLVRSYQHAYQALCVKSRFNISALFSKKKFLIGGLLLLLIMVLIPVRQTVLAPAQIIAKDPLIVTSPMNGVIDSIAVHSNQFVHEGDSLFALDSTDLKSQLAIAQKTYLIAKEKFRKATQHAFHDPNSKYQLKVLETEMSKRKIEADYLNKKLHQLVVRAKRNGVVIIGDDADLLGKPVQTGEKVMEIADPKQKQLEIWMSVNDTIKLPLGSDVKFFLNIDPVHPLKASVTYASYSAAMQANQSFAYRVKADFQQHTKVPRIGLQGTAKIGGEKVSLLYSLCWRPISAFRRAFGW